MIIGELNDIVRRLVAPKKDILAADESTNTINVEPTKRAIHLLTQHRGGEIPAQDFKCRGVKH